MTSTWNNGYITDINYIFGYYFELNPLRTYLAFLNKGLAYPKIRTACELGFGQGMSVNLHAAASDIEWYGTDFNPSQASFAQSLAKKIGANAHLYDDSFEEFTLRTDLPDFDFIGLHGIWSWINKENQAYIADFIRRKLKVGGILYISYNVFPGWNVMGPIRHLLSEYAELYAAKGQGVIERVSEALDFTEKLFATNPAYSRANPLASQRFENTKKMDKHYLAHEYFNGFWTPIYFADMAKVLNDAKLSFACSAHYLDHVDAVNLTAEQQELLKQYTDPVFHETVRDFLINQQFRRDYWVKGARRLSVTEQREQITSQRFVLTSKRDDIELKVNGALGEAHLQEGVYNPILDHLADHEIRSFGELLGELESAHAGVTFPQLFQALLVLIGAGHVVPVQDEDVVSACRERCKTCNAVLRDLARSNNDISYNASCVTGGGVMVDRFSQLFFRAKENGGQKPRDWARYVWDILKSNGQLITKNGKALTTERENMDELEERAKKFAERLKIFEILKVAD